MKSLIPFATVTVAVLSFLPFAAHAAPSVHRAVLAQTLANSGKIRVEGLPEPKTLARFLAEALPQTERSRTSLKNHCRRSTASGAYSCTLSVTVQARPGAPSEQIDTGYQLKYEAKISRGPTGGYDSIEVESIMIADWAG